jgi:hypothetical protein
MTIWMEAEMIPHPDAACWYGKGTALSCVLTLDSEVWLTELIDRQDGYPLMNERTPFITIESDSATYPLAELAWATDHEALLRWSDATGGVLAELHVRVEAASLRWSLALGGQARSWRVRFPFLAALSIGESQRVWGQTLHGEPTFRDSRERPIFQRVDWPLPCAWVGLGGRTLTLLGGPVTLMPSDPPSSWNWAELIFESRAEQRTVFEAEMILHTGGWAAAFDLFRAYVRATVNLSQYQRRDLAWYQNQLVQHFTFLYGRELLNLETGQFEIDRFLDQGERDFGGYDGMLIWAAYPRIGVDERTQWDFYDDLPGGRAGLQAMARRARERGTRLFVPYKPWDNSADLHGHATVPDHELLAKLVADVEADGVFLDTMSAIGGSFRDSLDQVRPGVALCSEGRARGAAMEVITSSWDQLGYVDTQQGNWSAAEVAMPAVNLRRFIFPEHRLFVVGRHALGDDRIRAIQRGFFNGMGWVVWQDIFGLAQPYTPAEAALLKRCCTLLREHCRALAGAHPQPLVPTLAQGVYANLFPGTAKRLWTLYNENKAPVNAPVLRISSPPGRHIVDLWNRCNVEPNERGDIEVMLEPQAIGALAELPRLLIASPDGARVTLAEPIVGAVIEVYGSTGSWSAPAGSEPIDLRPTCTEAALVRLLSDGELLDQIVVG